MCVKAMLEAMIQQVWSILRLVGDILLLILGLWWCYVNITVWNVKTSLFHATYAIIFLYNL